MTTKEIVEKIEEMGLETVNVYSRLIWQARTNGNQATADEFRYKLRGYLTALKDVGILSENDLKAAYLWYFSKDYSKEEKA